MRAEELTSELRERSFEHEYDCIDEKDHKESVIVVPFADAAVALSRLEYELALTEGEKDLLDIGRELNIKGKAKAMEYMEMLSKIPVFQNVQNTNF